MHELELGFDNKYNQNQMSRRISGWRWSSRAPESSRSAHHNDIDALYAKNVDEDDVFFASNPDAEMMLAEQEEMEQGTFGTSASSDVPTQTKRRSLKDALRRLLPSAGGKIGSHLAGLRFGTPHHYETKNRATYLRSFTSNRSADTMEIEQRKSRPRSTKRLSRRKLSHMKARQTMNIAGYTFDMEDDFMSFVGTLEENQHVMTLDLSETGITFERLEILAEVLLDKEPALEQLKVKMNALEKLPALNINKLDLSGNHLNEHMLFDGNHLCELILRSNQIDQRGMDILVRAELRQLRYLDLSGNNLDAAACDLLCELLISIPCLEALDLSYNESIGDMGCDSIMQQLLHTNLRELDLRSCGITAAGCKIITKKLKKRACPLTHFTVGGPNLSTVTRHREPQPSIGQLGVAHLFASLKTNENLLELCVPPSETVSASLKLLEQMTTCKRDHRKKFLQNLLFQSNSSRKKMTEMGKAIAKHDAPLFQTCEQWLLEQ